MSSSLVPSGHRRLCEPQSSSTAPSSRAATVSCPRLRRPGQPPSAVRTPQLPPRLCRPGRPPSVARILRPSVTAPSLVPVGLRQFRESAASPSSRPATVSCANPTPAHVPVAPGGHHSKVSISASARPTPPLLPAIPLLLTPNPALKYSVMIPIPFVPQGKRRQERLLNPRFSITWKPGDCSGVAESN